MTQPQTDFTPEEWWARLDTEIVSVIDEEGRNMAEAKLRATDQPEVWLYVDEVDGYSVLDQADADALLAHHG